jgi:hypothetical protein
VSLGSNLYPWFLSILLTPGLFSENEEISVPPPGGLSIRIYLFYENWSTETFGKNSEETSSFERVIDDARLALWLGSPLAVPNETDA